MDSRTWRRAIPPPLVSLNSSIAMVARLSKSRTGIRQESAQHRHPNPRTFEAQKAPANAKGCPPKFFLPLSPSLELSFAFYVQTGFSSFLFFSFPPATKCAFPNLCSSLPEHFPYGFACGRENPADLFVKTAMSCCLSVCPTFKIPTPTPQKKKFRRGKKEEETNAEPIPISLTEGFPTTSYC